MLQMPGILAVDLPIELPWTAQQLTAVSRQGPIGRTDGRPAGERCREIDRDADEEPLVERSLAVFRAVDVRDGEEAADPHAAVEFP